MKDVAVLMHETVGQMRRQFEQIARPMGITMMQWKALAHLEGSGPLRQVELAEALQTSPMTISDLADRMEAAGLIARYPAPQDNRAKLLELTKSGRDTIARMHAEAEELFAKMFDGCDPDRLAIFHDELSRMSANLGKF